MLREDNEGTLFKVRNFEGRDGCGSRSRRGSLRGISSTRYTRQLDGFDEFVPLLGDGIVEQVGTLSTILVLLVVYLRPLG